MAFLPNKFGGYGTGNLGDVSEIAGNVNSFAKVTALDSISITIDSSNILAGLYENFVAGSEILIHVSATESTTETDYLGKWGVATISKVTGGNVLSLNINPTEIIPSDELANYHVQAVTIANFQNFTLSNGYQLTPPIFSTASGYGGIVALKCSDTLTFDGGHINLIDRGIPVASKDLRPYLTQETNGTLDTDRYSAWENFITRERMLMNAGDGICFIMAKNFVGNENSRIGNINTNGAQFCRGATDSVGSKPANVTNIGGSTIFIVAENISDFNVKMLAKYRTSTLTAGQGLCRCYIATNNKMVNDEGLYAHDTISNPTLITKKMNIKDFGDGSIGDLTEITVQLNNYAKVTAISDDRKKLTYTGKTSAGVQQLTSGSLVMIHQNHKDSTTTAESGRFYLAKILADTGTDFTLNAALPEEFDATNYAVQVVSIPQANNFTLTGSNTATPKFDGAYGGILAIVVKNLCNISDGKLNVEGKGGGNAYGVEGLKTISNSNMSDRLPIGQGHGSVFILAKTLTMNNSTRIGATHDGAAFAGGKAGGYRGVPGGDYAGSTGGAGGSAAGAVGSGYTVSGYGSSSTETTQGAHVFIIADTINDFSLSAISTGGSGATYCWCQAYVSVYTSKTILGIAGSSGGAGYGGEGARGPDGRAGATSGGGSYNGGGAGAIHVFLLNSASSQISFRHFGYGGGASGWAFVFCNNAVNQDTTGTVA